MKLAYEAYNQSGAAVTGTIDAIDTGVATDRLRRDGLFVTHVRPVTDSDAAGPTRSRRSIFGGIGRLKNLSMFTRQLYVLVSTGTPLVTSLTALESQSRDARWRQVITSVRNQVQEGQSLSQAMAAHPDQFDSVYRSLIAIGEAGGDFQDVLRRLAELTQKRQQVRGMLWGAMIYPAMLMGISLTVLCVLLVVVLPRFVELFESMDVPLPPTTVFLAFLSDTLCSYWWGLLLVLGGGLVAMFFAFKAPRVKILLDTCLLRVPQFGRMTRNFATAQMVRLLAVLLNSHVPLLESLRLCRQAMSNVHYARLIAQVEQSVTRGEPMCAAFEGSDLVNASVYEAIRNGEASGQVAPLLLNMADFLDDENDVVLRSLTSILEPVILIVLGVVVGFVAVSLFMPLFDLTSMAGGGP